MICFLKVCVSGADLSTGYPHVCDDNVVIYQRIGFQMRMILIMRMIIIYLNDNVVNWKSQKSKRLLSLKAAHRAKN